MTKHSQSSGLVRLLSGWVTVMLLLCAGVEVRAVTITPDVIFTVRNSILGRQLDDDGGSGFQGLISNVSFNDRTFFDFDLSSAEAAPQADLTFELSCVGCGRIDVGTVFLSTYTANGIPETDDWLVAGRSQIASLIPSGIYTIDISDIYNAALGGYLGFALEISLDRQAFLGPDFSSRGIIEINAVPEPGSFTLLALGVVILGSRRIRTF
jgi:hypothetical protein